MKPVAMEPMREDLCQRLKEEGSELALEARLEIILLDQNVRLMDDFIKNLTQSHGKTLQ